MVIVLNVNDTLRIDTPKGQIHISTNEFGHLGSDDFGQRRISFVADEEEAE